MTPNRASGCVTKNYFLLKKCLHCLYTKVHQNYFPFEQLSAQVYTPKMGRGRNGPVEQSMKKPKRSKFQERGGDLQVFRTHYKQHHDSLFLSEGLLQSWTKLVETYDFHALLTNVSTCKRVQNILSPSPPTQCCFLRFAVQQALF